MATRIISDPVRSGQQIYVADGDLVVSTTVSPGAEVVADGCVHIYGALRGRAIAGARGETSARIFCRRFEAELVAISSEERRGGKACVSTCRSRGATVH